MLITPVDDRLRQGVLWSENSTPSPDRAGNTSGLRDAVFFALQPSLDAARCAARLASHLRDTLGLSGEPLGERCFHVSLFSIGYHGQLPYEAMAAAGAAAATVPMRCFRVTFDRAESFNGKPKRPLVLVGDEGLTGIRMLRHQLVSALRKSGLRGGSAGGFTPHLTLLYDERNVPARTVEAIGWTVNEFVLVRSLYGHGRHILLARWKLRR